MKNMTLYLPGFHLATLRRKPRSAQQIMAEKLADLKQKTFTQLGECFAPYIPKKILHPADSGALSRQRLFSKENTFWAFLSQVLDADGGCQEVVRKLQAFAAIKSNECGLRGAARIKKLLIEYEADARLARQLTEVSDQAPIQSSPFSLDWQGIDTKLIEEISEDIDFSRFRQRTWLEMGRE